MEKFVKKWLFYRVSYLDFKKWYQNVIYENDIENKDSLQFVAETCTNLKVEYVMLYLSICMFNLPSILMCNREKRGCS